MMQEENVTLIKVCDTEAQKILSTLKEILDALKNPDFKLTVIQYKDDFKETASTIEQKQKELTETADESKKVSKVITKAMTSAKLLVDKQDAHIASILFDSCNALLKQLYQCCNDNCNADEDIKELARHLIETAIELRESSVAYL